MMNLPIIKKKTVMVNMETVYWFRQMPYTSSKCFQLQILVRYYSYKVTERTLIASIKLMIVLVYKWEQIFKNVPNYFFKIWIVA